MKVGIVESLIYFWIVRAAMYGVSFAHDIRNFVEELNYLLVSLNILVFGNFFKFTADVSLSHYILFSNW